MRRRRPVRSVRRGRPRAARLLSEAVAAGCRRRVGLGGRCRSPAAPTPRAAPDGATVRAGPLARGAADDDVAGPRAANCGPGAGPWSPPAAASTSCTPGTSRPCRPPAASATRSWCWSTPTRRCAGSRARTGRWSRQDDRARVLLAFDCVDAVVRLRRGRPARGARGAAPGRLGQGRRLRRDRPCRRPTGRLLGRQRRPRAVPVRSVHDDHHRTHPRQQPQPQIWNLTDDQH